MIIDYATWLSLIAVRKDSGVFWGRFDHRRPGLDTTDWAIIIGATSLLLVVMLYSYWRSKRQKLEFLRNSAPQMFNELSRAHRLDHANRRLLKRLAAAHGAKNAATLFVEPEYFDATKMPTSLQPAASTLRQLRHGLFD